MVRAEVRTDDFAKLHKKNRYYMDKTKLLYDIAKNCDKVNLFTRPRRFGKTLMMSMIEVFFNNCYRRLLCLGL